MIAQARALRDVGSDLNLHWGSLSQGSLLDLAPPPTVTNLLTHTTTFAYDGCQGQSDDDYQCPEQDHHQHILLFALADLCLFGMLIWRINHRGDVSIVMPDEVILSLSFIGLSIVAFGWLWLSIRYAECKTSVAGYVLKHLPASEWFTSFLTLTRCPNCGSLGNGHPPH